MSENLKLLMCEFQIPTEGEFFAGHLDHRLNHMFLNSNKVSRKNNFKFGLNFDNEENNEDFVHRRKDLIHTFKDEVENMIDRYQNEGDPCARMHIAKALYLATYYNIHDDTAFNSSNYENDDFDDFMYTVKQKEFSSQQVGKYF